MNGYEKIINTIRSEARKNGKHTISLKIGVMTSRKSCKIGQIELDKDDIYVSEHLTKKVLNKLDFQIESSGGTSHTHKWTDKSEYFSPLKKGDVVLIAQISNLKFVILDKLVEVK